jgi:hypothetical protein
MRWLPIALGVDAAYATYRPRVGLVKMLDAPNCLKKLNPFLIVEITW